MATADADKKDEPISSPCIGVCTMSEAMGLCQGCYRTMDEIREWWDMTPSQRSQAMDISEQRRTELVKLD